MFKEIGERMITYDEFLPVLERKTGTVIQDLIDELNGAYGCDTPKDEVGKLLAELKMHVDRLNNLFNLVIEDESSLAIRKNSVEKNNDHP